MAIIPAVEEHPARSTRGLALAARLEDVSNNLVELLLSVGPGAWSDVPAQGVWSIGKDAEHVAEAAAYHQWIVHRTIGSKVGSRRPSLERAQLTTSQTPAEAVELIRVRTDEGIRLLVGLTDGQLALPTCPPRAQGQRLAETIERVLIGHYAAHRLDVAAKLRSGS